jgi:hypothetical protein
MKIIITSEVDTNIGLPLSNIIGSINANTDTLLNDGRVHCKIDFYIDDAAKASRKNMVFPVVLNTDGTIYKIVASCVITLTQEQVEAANLPATIYSAVAEKLTDDYGWTVVVA